MPEKKQDISTGFGELIKDLHNKKGLAQEKLAELSRLHANYISLIKRGKRKPTIDTIFNIASTLDMRPHILIRRLEDAIGDI